MAQKGSVSHGIGPMPIAGERDVDDALCPEHRFEEDRVGDERGHAGQEDRGAKEAASPELAVVERDCKEQREDDHDRHLHHEEDHGVAERAQEHRVLRQALDVGEAAETEVHARGRSGSSSRATR